ncbi:EamA family transporter [Variovorax sp. UC122_21]|uniref:EamA family transporter n=1 Tax=Variovorax sp. UC122_21 TaxID=3374554 RepID=UPI0037578F57
MKQSGVFEMLAAMAICGTIGITVLMSGQSEVSLIFYRCFFGALVLLAICLLRGYISASILKPRLIAYSLVGGAALLANWYFLFRGLREDPPSASQPPSTTRSRSS